MNTRGSPQTDVLHASLRRRSRFSLSSLPLKHRLPLLIGTLLLGIITVSIWTSYSGVKESALEVGSERLRSLTRQLANQTQQSLPIVLNRTFTVANDPAVRNFFRAPSPSTRPAAVSILQQFAPVQDPGSSQVELWNTTGSVVLTVPDNSSPEPADLTEEFKQSGVGPFKAVGPLRLVKNVLMYTVVVAAKDDQGKVMGYLVRWRVVAPTPNARKQLSDLLGSEAALYYGNSKGDLFTDLEKAVPRPPVDLGQTLEVTHYRRDGNPVMAMGQPVLGTPWFLLVEFPERTFLVQAHRFLWRILMIGVVLLGGGVTGAFVLTRSITRPLQSLTKTASAIGGGDYSSVVAVRRNDELGELANAFNVMLVKVRDTQRELERDISERTARLEAAPSAMLMVDERGRMTLVNAQLEQLFGYDRSELLDQPVEMLVPERYRNVHSGHRANFFHSPSTRVMGAGRDLFGLRKDGTEVPIEIGLNPIKTDKGLFVLASIIDITERKRAEERFRLVVEASPSAMIMVNGEGRITLVNTQTEHLFGYARSELLDQPVEMLVPERYRGAHPGHRTGFFQTPSARAMGAGRNLFGRHKDGSEIPIEIGLNPIKTEEGAFVLASIIDITERKRAEERFRLVVEASPSAILMVNDKGRITLVNAQTEKLFGCQRAELLDQPIEVLVPERYRAAHPGRRTGFFQTPSTRAMGAGRDLYGLRKDGTEMPIEIGLNPINTDEGAFVLASIIDITERKRAEERFRQVIEGAPNGMVMVGREGKIALVNLQIEKSFGYSRDELLGQPIEMLVPERFRGHHLGYRNGFMAEPSTRSMGSGRDLYGLRKDGSEFPVEIGLNPLETEQGPMVLGTIVDITERKQTEEARRATEARYRTLFENAPLGILISDTESYYLDANASMCRMLGYTRDELIGFHASDIVSESEVQHIEPALGTIKAKDDYHREWQFKRKDGSCFAAEVIATMMPDGNLLGMVRDITERKQADEKLRKSQEQLAGVIDSAMDAIITVDQEQRIVLFNAAAERAFLFPAEDAIGQPLDRFIPERFRAGHNNHIDDFGKTHVTRRSMGTLGALYGLRADGEEFPLEASISQVESDGRRLYTVILRDITERKRAEEALKEHARILDLAPVLIRDLKGRILFWNTGAEQMYGWKSEEALEKMTHQLFQTEFPRPLEEIRARLLARGHWEGELVHTRKDGERIVVASHWVLHRDENDKPKAILELNNDITERKQAEKALRESEERLHLAVRSTKLGTWEVIVETGERLWSDQSKAIFGFPPGADVNAENLSQLVHPDDRKRTDEALKRALQPEGDGELHTECRILIDGGKVERWIEWRGRVIFESGRAVRIIGTLLDITDRKQAQETLRESEERLRLGIQAAELGTWDYRFHTGEVFFDERGARNFGLKTLATTFDDAIGRIFPDDRERVNTAADQALNGENDGMYEQEFRVIWPDNSVHWLAAYGRAHFEGEGQDRRAIRFIGINMDITERKQAEKEIHRLNEELEQRVADRTAQLQAVNKELEAFSYSVSHDLRAPLRHIDGFSQALLEDYTDKLDDAGKSYLREVRSASQEMAQLIDDVLELARVTRSEMRREVVNLSDLARTIAAELKKREPKRKVILNLKEDLTTRGDKRLLRIVLNNLLGNAWKFTAKRTEGQITLGREQKNGESTYFIRDNGAGFDMAYVGKLFGAFQRLHTAGEFEGTGIGLATVQRIVYRHGGRVWAEGAVNKGATFYFTLPNSKEIGDESQSDPTG